jgi:hypothetical protein
MVQDDVCMRSGEDGGDRVRTLISHSSAMRFAVIVQQVPTRREPTNAEVPCGCEGQHMRATYAVTVSYLGPKVNGWAWAPGLQGTAQGIIQDALPTLISLPEVQHTTPPP